MNSKAPSKQAASIDVLKSVSETLLRIEKVLERLQPAIKLVKNRITNSSKAHPNDLNLVNDMPERCRKIIKQTELLDTSEGQDLIRFLACNFTATYLLKMLHACKTLNIRSIEDLENTTYMQLDKIPTVGNQTFAMLRKALHSRDVKLIDDDWYFSNKTTRKA